MMMMPLSDKTSQRCGDKCRSPVSNVAQHGVYIMQLRALMGYSGTDNGGGMHIGNETPCRTTSAFPEATTYLLVVSI